MDENTPRIRSLLRQAKRNESAGKRAVSEELYRIVISESPDTVDAWLGLARVLKDPAEEEAAYLQALSLDPENIDASDGLAIIKGEKKPFNPTLEEEIHAVNENESPSFGETNINNSEYEVKFESTDVDISSESAAAVDRQETQKNGNALAIDHDHQAAASNEVLFCANHPSRETHLKCNRCGKPICSSCARLTPVGYRCPECIREHEDIFYTATAVDYLIAALLAFPLGFIAGYLAWLFTSIGFFGFFLIFLAPAVGTFLARIIIKAVGRRRGRWLPYLVASAIVIPGLLFLLASVINFRLFGIILMGIYVIAASGAAYYQMR
jgi:hypothetical protein